ncbi:spore coat protein U domain-containing protein [Psychrobacter sp. GP33]|uniref:Csu type fimbrial protein n=1 Tax=Psychrobacter sp. GP33 TaxID=2758709 RepID=UPI0015FAEDA5|nr:spore coat protein U domain-containing protein [Psychrobacter sp. GP33]
MTFNKTLLTATILTLGGFAAMSANAGEKTGAFAVNMTVTSACNIATSVGANDISFGSVAAGVVPTANKESKLAIAVNCSKAAPYIITLEPSNKNPNGLGDMTHATLSAEKIAYQLYSDDAGTNIWGNTGVLGTVGNSVSDTGKGLTTATNHSVYATVQGSTENNAVGLYNDNVTVKVLY